MSALIHCVECSATNSPKWWGVAEGRWLCTYCAQQVRDVFALAAELEMSGVDLLLKVCDE